MYSSIVLTYLENKEIQEQILFWSRVSAPLVAILTFLLGFFFARIIEWRKENKVNKSNYRYIQKAIEVLRNDLSGHKNQLEVLIITRQININDDEIRERMEYLIPSRPYNVLYKGLPITEWKITFDSKYNKGKLEIADIIHKVDRGTRLPSETKHIGLETREKIFPLIENLKVQYDEFNEDVDDYIHALQSSSIDESAQSKLTKAIDTALKNTMDEHYSVSLYYTEYTNIINEINGIDQKETEKKTVLDSWKLLTTTYKKIKELYSNEIREYKEHYDAINKYIFFLDLIMWQMAKKKSRGLQPTYRSYCYNSPFTEAKISAYKETMKKLSTN